MFWKIKATIQNLVSILPQSVSRSLYYSIQRNYGALKQVRVKYEFEKTVKTIRALQRVFPISLAKEFVEAGFEYVTDMESVRLFRKRK